MDGRRTGCALITRNLLTKRVMPIISDGNGDLRSEACSGRVRLIVCPFPPLLILTTCKELLQRVDRQDRTNRALFLVAVMAPTTRTFLELRVGRTHMMDVLLYVRRSDLTWFHSSPDHRRELLRLLSQQIVPKEYEEEIDSYHALRNPKHRPPSAAGEKNRPAAKGGRKRKTKEVDLPKPEKPKREFRHVFGDKIQVTYRVEETRLYESATLIFPKRKDASEEPSNFRQLPKLSKRIVAWCYPLDPDNPMEPNPEGGGFPRPDLIPVTALFRTPQAEISDSL